MQVVKKYMTEGLIQWTILLSLIGVRVDIDSYLNGYYPPLIENNLGQSSAYIQTPFHNLRDTLDGYTVHPKCPELDYFFASRRLLNNVRTLGSPRFPTHLNAWLVHQVSATDNAECGQLSANNSSGNDLGLENSGYEATDEGENLRDNEQELCQTSPEVGQGPYIAGASEFLRKEVDAKVKEEEETVPVTQLAHSSTLEQESLLEGVTALSDPERPPAATDTHQPWSHLLPLSVTDLEELDSLRLTDLDADMTSAISQDVSLQDAMVNGGAIGLPLDRVDATAMAQQQRSLFRSESSDSSHASPGMALGLAALPFVSVCNLTGNTVGGCLDEAVFDQINQLGLECLDTIDTQILGCLDNINPQVLEDLDSDSGLSLESSSGGPVSPDSSEMSSSSSLYCEEECGATGYSSEVDSVPAKGSADHNTLWSPVDLTGNVWHDHSYSSPAFFHQPSATPAHKGIKEEPYGEGDGPILEERELSRDELRARAMCIPFSVLQIVHMPVEEFLELVDGHGFSSEQVTLLRDIRRRGKNKLAAQNCRKRKLDVITGLQEEVEKLQAQRDRLLREKQLTAKTMCAVGQQIQQLTRDVLARLRDDSGQSLNPDRFTLQCRADGGVVVQPVTRPAMSKSTGSKSDKRKKGKKQ